MRIKMKIILSVIIIIVFMSLNKAITDSYRVTIQDRIAVSQLEDSDINAIAINVSTNVIKRTTFISILFIFVFLYIIWIKISKKDRSTGE